MVEPYSGRNWDDGIPQQIQLLRVLQEGEFEPIGSTRTAKVVRPRHRRHECRLKAEMAAGRFREDLFLS